MLADVLGLLALLALRIGVPLLVIMSLSYVAYRWLGAEERKPAQPAAEAPRVSLGGPAPIARVLYAGAHCWDIKKCPADLKATCPAYARPELPCWLAVQMKTGHLRNDCPDCSFYEQPAARV